MMSFHSKHPKNAVKALMEGIHPASLKAVVQIHLNLDQKHLRNSVLQFMVYVKTKLVAQLEFTWAAKSVGLVKAAGEDKPRQMDQAPKRARSLKKDVLRAFTGPNLLDVCVSASETEKEATREKKKAKWANRKSVKPKIFKTLRRPLHEPSDGSCWAEIPGVHTNDLVAALVDSGSNPRMVVSLRLMEKASTIDWQSEVEGFAKVPLCLSKHLILPELRLLTGDQ
ncbi:hypothetical protein DYB25_010235 [Aphanomyces astaci]|uniref:Uncharacterized protein n=1 Tax=Aphanomyces astaci TaxID=112090 RepID=A0A397B5N3_APHAT|nr:hypothetical protein DYB36_001574 [Aphanomyces astaci]RHY15557.1 hypothetical protein DYB25_010235 [Aphanomyces astaci]RHY55598.1 hypothetical protein DYB30_004920 [Aphanomyces astaci]